MYLDFYNFESVQKASTTTQAMYLVQTVHHLREFISDMRIAVSSGNCPEYWQALRNTVSESDSRDDAAVCELVSHLLEWLDSKAGTQPEQPENLQIALDTDR